MLDVASPPPAEPTTEHGQPPATAAGRKGYLVVVGIGIQWCGQTTHAARIAIERAERVFFAVSDPWAARFVCELNPRAEPLEYPRDGRERHAIYAKMCSTILQPLADGTRVCAVFYGSAAVLTRPAHAVIKDARAAGHSARLLPGVSSLDCLFADLGFDPGDGGVQFFEAGQFLTAGAAPNPHAHLVLCQVAMIGNRRTYAGDGAASIRCGLAKLESRLREAYPADHEVVIYEASSHPTKPFRATRLPLSRLSNAEVREISTLYVPCRAKQEATLELESISISPKEQRP